MLRPTLRVEKHHCRPVWGFLAVIGLVLAVAGARTQPPAEFPDEVLARVNDRPVTRSQLSNAENRLSARAGERLSSKDRELLVELLIDEELLLQRAEALGVVQADPSVRKAIIQAVIDDIVEAFLASSPDRQQVEQFYRSHRAMFERPARVAVAALRFDSLAEARRASASIAGGDGWADLEARPEARPLTYLPGSPLPQHVLRRYLGPGPASVAQSLEPGSISSPVEGAGGAYLLRVTDAVYPSVPRFDEIEAVVRDEYLSRGREAALTSKLVQLWNRADIHFNTRVVRERPGKYATDDGR